MTRKTYNMWVHTTTGKRMFYYAEARSFDEAVTMVASYHNFKESERIRGCVPETSDLRKGMVARIEPYA